MAFIARLTMASETGSDGAAGGSGVLQSINISSDSPSAISDLFGQSEGSPGTKKNSDFFVRKLASIIINVLLIQTLTVSSHFSSGHSQGNSQSVSTRTEPTINQSTRMSNLPESPLVQSHLSATTVLDDITMDPMGMSSGGMTSTTTTTTITATTTTTSHRTNDNDSHHAAAIKHWYNRVVGICIFSLFGQ